MGIESLNWILHPGRGHAAGGGKNRVHSIARLYREGHGVRHFPEVDERLYNWKEFSVHEVSVSLV